MKFYYFPGYGRGEPIRMALWKAGVQFERVDTDHEAVAKLREEGKLPFGQVPALELDDGTVLAQGNAILNYVGNKYNLKPADALAVYKGEALSDLVWMDFVMKAYPKMMASKEAED